MKSCEGIGKTIEKAIENALLELKATREDVDIKIIDEGGLFKKAKVLVTISEECLDKYENRKNISEDEENEEVLDVKAIFAEIPSLIKDEKEEKKEIKEQEKQEKKDIKEKEKQEKKEHKSKEKISGVEFIKGFLELFKTDYQVYCQESEEEIIVKVEGGNTGDLIGYRGECLNAIQYIASVVETEFSGKRKKFILDIENYRQKREETLKALAHRMENKVIKTKRPMKLEPMTANERRIIHTELQKSEYVTTTSKGTEPARYIVILPKNEEQEENTNQDCWFKDYNVII